MTSLLHVGMERSESIKDFIKRFGLVILQLDIVNADTVMLAVK